MKTQFNIDDARWDLSASKRVPRHDLCFGTPINAPTAGLPIGDGDTGTLLWLEKDGLHLCVNKCDLWQDAPPGVTWDDECYCSGHEEELTSVKHAGEITVRFDAPVFEYLYQKRFTARLSLAYATAAVDAETPFGGVKVRAFAEHESGVTVLEICASSEDLSAPAVTLSRWGSRTLWRWYSQQKSAPETGLDGTDARLENGRLTITQELNATTFCIGLSLVGEVPEPAVVNRHTASYRLPAERSHAFTLYVTVKTGHDAEDAREKCAAALRDAEKTGAEALHERHAAAWQAFWDRSFAAISDDYLENICALYFYIMNSESRGAYPPHFTSGLWGFYHDYIPWVYYFHYNIQHMYAPLDAAGHGELAENYYALRKNGMPAFRRYAERVKKMPGLFVHDVTDRYGRGADYDSLNCTPAAQIAMEMLRHVRYTGDRAFLEETALPMMRGAADFYLGMLREGDDGLYHIHGTTAYEGNAPTDDTLTDYVMIRALFPALAEFSEGEERDRLLDVVSRLPAPMLLPLEEVDWDGEVFTFGLGKGKKPVGDGRVFGIGTRDGEPVRKSYGDPACPKRGYGFPDIELSPLYPAGIFGLKDRGSPLFQNMTDQLMLHQCGADSGHWNMLPVYLARMGRGGEFLENCRGMIEANQGFLNGFNAESGEGGSPGGWPMWYEFTDVGTHERRMVKTDDFTHFDFETGPILTMGVLESLLQSHEGVIRVFPAVKDGDCAAFVLYAQGGFRVGGEISPEGCVVTVTACRAGDCFVCLPTFPGWRAYRRTDGRFREMPITYADTGYETAIALNGLDEGDTVLFTTVPLEALEFEPQTVSAPNGDWKRCGRVALGSPRLMSPPEEAK
ncbi:MAG: hypothetical protein II889_01865 [Clostridia bacterium]|nr:hypothetical protein [Clostridia bacterium]